jgi:hypothetical protein
VPKKKAKVSAKYLAGVKGSKRKELASVLRKISALYKAGKRVPKSLLDKRIKLGSKSKASK